jgi:hypothetical protein
MRLRLGYGLTISSSEHGNEPSGCIKVGKFVGKLNEIWILNNNSVNNKCVS